MKIFGYIMLAWFYVVALASLVNSVLDWYAEREARGQYLYWLVWQGVLWRGK